MLVAVNDDELRRLSDERDRLKQGYAALESENAKLLELLQRTWDAFHDATAREFVRVKNELRELGVEVDDG